MSDKKKLISLVLFVIITFTTVSRDSQTVPLDGDEAQYWAWSRKIDFGYYSKPPLLPWIIFLITSLFGSSFFVLKIKKKPCWPCLCPTSSLLHRPNSPCLQQRPNSSCLLQRPNLSLNVNIE